MACELSEIVESKIIHETQVTIVIIRKRGFDDHALSVIVFVGDSNDGPFIRSKSLHGLS